MYDSYYYSNLFGGYQAPAYIPYLGGPYGPYGPYMINSPYSAYLIASVTSYLYHRPY